MTGKLRGWKLLRTSGRRLVGAVTWQEWTPQGAGVEGVRQLGKAGVGDDLPVCARQLGGQWRHWPRWRVRRRSGREAWRWLRFSMFAGLGGQSERDAAGHLAVWICNFGENRAREGGSGTAGRLMVMATGERVLITRDLVSRGLGQWPEECTLWADGRGPS